MALLVQQCTRNECTRSQVAELVQKSIVKLHLSLAPRTPPGGYFDIIQKKKPIALLGLLFPPAQSDQLPLIRDYKSKIETELTDICDDILKIIEAELIPNSTSEEGKVFYYKMKGDYHR